jgi:thiosulfate reductase cytochrome b subunit
MASLAPPIGMATPQRFYRHRLIVRLTHWTNAVAIFILLMSGLQIFNAHPALYWGQYGADYDNAHRWLEIGAVDGADGQPKGVTRIGPVTLTTTGVLGLSNDSMGQPTAIAFPHWVTIPSYRDLATGRRWHFFFAWVLILNGLTYLLAGIASGHFRKNLLPTAAELAPSNILHDIGSHIRLQFPKGEDAKRYHILQKLAYGGVVFVVLPLIVLTGLTMSPSNAAAWHWLAEVFGGRQSARSIHFICANLIVLFIIVHLLMVLLAGPINEIRSMVTGWFTVEPEDAA